MIVGSRTLRLAIIGRHLEHLFAVEANAAVVGSREADGNRDRLELKRQNGDTEAARLARLSMAWRARTLAMLDIDRGGMADQALDETARRWWQQET